VYATDQYTIDTRLSGYCPEFVLISCENESTLGEPRTMSITISADDPRTIKAIEIAAEAGQWVPCRADDGEAAYRVPSQGHLGRFYVVTESRCDCPDFQHNDLLDSEAGDQRACKHVLAVRLHLELTRAVQRHAELRTQRRRDHLRLLPPTFPR
jgi:predicted nucleic acid-binding Zn finger protein